MTVTVFADHKIDLPVIPESPFEPLNKRLNIGWLSDEGDEEEERG